MALTDRILDNPGMAGATGTWVRAPEPDEILLGLGMWLVSTGRAAAGATYQLQHRVFDPAVIILTESGTGWVRLHGRTYTVRAGDLLFLPPNVDHGYGTDGSEWGLVWANVAGPLTTRLASQWVGEGPVVRNPHPLVRDLLYMCLEEMDTQPPGHHLAATHLAIAALGCTVAASARPHGQNASRAATLTAAAQEYLTVHLAEPLTLVSVSRAMHVGVEHLCRSFRQCTDTTPMRYLESRRIAVAVDLVTTTDLPINEVAHQVGYSDPAHFSRVFRRVAGTAPSQLRALHQNAGGR